MKKSIQGAAAVLILLLLLSHPVLAYEGAKNGLLLWSQTVLPTLLPFMICSNAVSYTHLDVYKRQEWSARRFLHGSGNRHCLLGQAPFVICFSQAGNRKSAVGPPTSWMYPLKSGSSVKSMAS